MVTYEDLHLHHVGCDIYFLLHAERVWYVRLSDQAWEMDGCVMQPPFLRLWPHSALPGFYITRLLTSSCEAQRFLWETEFS